MAEENGKIVPEYNNAKAGSRVDICHNDYSRLPKRAEMFGILTGEALTEGKPLEGPSNVCYISQSSSGEHMVDQTEATTIVVNSGIAHSQQSESEAPNQEVNGGWTNTGIFQQQFALNQQLLLQQQQTVTALMGKVDKLTKIVEKRKKTQALLPISITQELWNTTSLAKSSKEMDKSFQTTQRYLNQGLVPLVMLMNKMLKTENTEDFRLARDAFQLLAYAHRDMSKVLKPVFASLRKIGHTNVAYIDDSLLKSNTYETLAILQDVSTAHEHVGSFEYRHS